jgi:hypothetical protein
LSSLGQWSVKVEYPKCEVQSKGVIGGIPTDVSEKEIQEACSSNGVQSVRRLKRKVEGKWEDSWSVCLTFSRKYLPPEICIGYEMYQVKPYVEKVVRCFKCQRLGHMTSTCKGKVRCVRCGGSHTFEQCTGSIEIKCCRCGENHSAAYEGCETIKHVKRINTIKAKQGVSYAEAAKVVKEATYVAPLLNMRLKKTQ